MLRRRLCPGSLALESSLPAYNESNEYQAEGSLLHAMLADPSLSRDGLAPSQLELILTVEASESAFLKTIRNAPFSEVTEQAFSLYRNGAVLLTGHPDSVVIFGKPACVVVRERKCGYSAVQTADANLQLRCYLTLVASAYPAERYIGFLMQPRVSLRPQVVEYTPADIVKSRAEIEAIFDACYAPNAPRRPSPIACEFCRAQSVCDEFKSWAFAVERSAHLPSAQWPDEVWNEFLTKRPIVEKFLKERLEDAKLIKAASPDRLPEWDLRDGAERRIVTDIVGAWGALQSRMTAKEFSDACELSLGDIEDSIWKKHKDNPDLGRLSQRDAKRLVNSILASFITILRNKPSLVPKDE